MRTLTLVLVMTILAVALVVSVQGEVLSACRLVSKCRSFEVPCEQNRCHGARNTSCCRRCGSCTCRLGKCWKTRHEKREGTCGGWPVKKKCCVQC